MKEKDPIENAIWIMSRLPGFGEKSAGRLVYWLLKDGKKILPELGKVLKELSEKVQICSSCGDFSVSDPCPICSDPNRDKALLMVVEDGKAIKAIEKTRAYQGLYHILGGLLSPRLGLGPERLRVKQLLERIKKSAPKEVIIGLSSSQEGEATTQWLIQNLEGLGVSITRLARGLPVATSLEYLDLESLSLAIKDRKKSD